MGHRSYVQRSTDFKMGLLLFVSCFSLMLLDLPANSAKEFSLARYSDTAVYANNSVIDLRLVGEGFEGAQITDGGALECHTDDTTCCRGIDNPPNGTGRGEWYYPDGTVVPRPGGNGTGLYRTRDRMVIRLNRNSVTEPTGVYRCEIPGNGEVMITRYIALISGICDDLPDLTNGAITYTPPRGVSAGLPAGQRYTGTIATYSCSPEYQLVEGSLLRVCGDDGMWNGTEPTCGAGPTTQTAVPTGKPVTISSTSNEVPTATTTAGPTTQTAVPTDKPVAISPTSNEVPTTTTTIVGPTTQTAVPTNNPVTISPTSNEVPTTTTGYGETSDSPNIAGPAVGAVLGILAVVLLIVLAVVIVIVLRRHSKSDNKDKYKHPKPELGLKENLELSPVDGQNVSMKQDDSKAPSIIEFPSDIKSTEGEMVHLRVRVSGHPSPTINWYHDGVAVRADYSREIDEHGGLMFPSVEKAHSGSYKLMVANSSGKAEKEVIVSVGCDGCDGGGSEETKKAVPVSEFGVYVAQHHVQGNKMFTQVYQSLDSGDRGHKITVAVSKENKPANRFKNITVYDDNHVVLQPISGEADCQTDYINASYIDGYSVSSKFIASQGPLPHTVVDFWRMVWQERPSAIVMLTNCEEGGRVKCEQYWPESGNKSYGPFQIIITDKQILADYTVRSFVVTTNGSKDGKSLKLSQFHFTAWPDHGVPEYATPILAFLRRIRAHHVPSTGPLIVHCSAGVGRTGTYITLDNVFDQIKAEGLVDIDGVIVKARKQRMKMVQTKDQYIFIHDTILEFVTCGDTQISSVNFRMAISKLKQKDPDHKCTSYQHQFNVLDQVSPNPTEVNSSTALKHPDKNRGNKYLPVENSRIVLIGEQPDYIHAVATNGYKHRKAYIIAQNPLKSTVRNFWKVIADRKCAAIVMLSKLKENKKEACAVYWPEEGGAGYGEFKVDITGKEEFPEFVIRKLVISNFKTHQSHQVTQFHVTNWSPGGTCSNLKVITDVIEEVAKVQRRTGNNPILVHCSDTVSRSGMFCAIATTIDRCKTEGVVDVFQVVKALRIHKPGAVLNVEQYKLVHEAVLTFLESFESYANFQAV